MTIVKKRAQNIASTTLEQLGGFGKLKAMINARKFRHGEEGDLTFQFSGSRKANIVRIELTGRDDYTLKFYKQKRFDLDLVNTIDGVYCDNLKKAFENETGLKLSL